MNRSRETPQVSLRVLRIIIAAMVCGLLAFGAVAVFLVEGGTKRVDPGLANLLLPVIGMLAISELVAYFVVRGAILRKAVEPLPPHLPPPPGATPMGRLATVTLIGCAMAEGIGLFAIVTYLLTGNRLAWIAAAAALLTLAMQWPTQARLASFTPHS